MLVHPGGVMARYGYFEIERTCAGCGRPLPVNGPLERVRCASCQEVTPIPMLMFEQVFEIFDDHREKLAPGQTKSHSPLGAGGMYRLSWAQRAPACRECGTDLTSISADAGAFGCPQCKAGCSTSAPPAWLSGIYPAVKQIYLADSTSGTAASAGAEQEISVDQSRTRPILMACQSCGANLSVTADTPRIHACEFCSTSVGIPDGLWERLHPVDAVRGWYARFDGGTAGKDEKLARSLDARYDEESLSLTRGGKLRGKPPAGPSRWITIRMHTKCPQCTHPIPVNGPLPHVVCPSCGTVVQIPPRTLGGYMAWLSDDRPIFDGVAVSGGMRFQMKSTRFAAYCEICDTALPVADVGTDAIVRCPGCAAQYPTFPVPEPFVKHAGPARQLTCAQRDPDPPREQVPASLSYTCPSCGADLTIDADTGRIHHCQFCSSDVFIPDEVWARLHPVERVRTWFVDAGVEPEPRVGPDEMLRDAGDAVADAQARARRQMLIGFGAIGAVAALVLLIVIIASC
jgi:LSD1 subclass zinc finger protein